MHALQTLLIFSHFLPQLITTEPELIILQSPNAEGNIHDLQIHTVKQNLLLLSLTMSSIDLLFRLFYILSYFKTSINVLRKASSFMYCIIGLRVTNSNPHTERHSSPTYRGWATSA